MPELFDKSVAKAKQYEERRLIAELDYLRNGSRVDDFGNENKYSLHFIFVEAVLKITAFITSHFTQELSRNVQSENTQNLG